MKYTKVTSTSLVNEALIKADDFVTGRQLQDTLMLDTNHVSAALYHLRKYKAAECMEVAGTLYWFATPQNDTRSKIVEERTPESRPRKPRKSKFWPLAKGDR